MIQNLGPSEIIVSGGILMIVIKELIGLIKQFAPKTEVITSKDMKQMEYQAAMNGLVRDVKDILIKLSEKQSETKEIVREIEHIESNTHKRIGKIESGVEVLKAVITKESIKESVGGAIKELGLGKA